MHYEITLTHRYPDAYSGELSIYEYDKTRYKCYVVILKSLVEKIRSKGNSYKITYKNEPTMLLPLCPTIAVGRTTVPFVPVQGKSKHDHIPKYIYLVSKDKKYLYEGNVCNMSKRFFDKESTATITEAITEDFNEPYFISQDGILKADEEDDEDWTYEDEDFTEQDFM